jgi:hypothetical protein
MKPGEWLWLDHIEEQIKERGIPKELVELTINEPDDVVTKNKDALHIKRKLEINLLE